MRTIFIDVGGHIGQTLAEVTRPTYRFDHAWPHHQARINHWLEGLPFRDRIIPGARPAAR
jgi:hypothetical protein